MNLKKLLTTVALSAIVLTGCSLKKDTIIKVNNENITMAQYNETFNEEVKNSMFSKMGIDVKNPKNAFMATMLKDKVVNELIIKTLVNQEIEKRHITVTEDDTNKALKDIIDQVGSKERFSELLQQNGITADQFKKDLTEDVKMKKLVTMISKVNISDADAKKFYKSHIDQFNHPDRVRASHILISANPEEIRLTLASDAKNKGLSSEEVNAKIKAQMASQYAKAQQILAEVKKNPEEFAKLAKENSDDTASATKGGDLGYFTRKDMVEPFAKVAFTQKPNTISEIVQTPYGYHIIMVKDRMKSGQDPFAKVKDRIKSYLENQAQVKVLDNLIETLKAQAKIEYVNPEFNPKNIQDEIKKISKANAEAEKAASKGAKTTK